MKQQRWIEKVGAMTRADLSRLRLEFDSYEHSLVTVIQTTLRPISNLEAVERLSGCVVLGSDCIGRDERGRGKCHRRRLRVGSPESRLSRPYCSPSPAMGEIGGVARLSDGTHDFHHPLGHSPTTVPSSGPARRTMKTFRNRNKPGVEKWWASQRRGPSSHCRHPAPRGRCGHRRWLLARNRTEHHRTVTRRW